MRLPEGNERIDSFVRGPDHMLYAGTWEHGDLVRIVQLTLSEYTAKARRAIREGRSEGPTMLLATDRTDLPAEVMQHLKGLKKPS